MEFSFLGLFFRLLNFAIIIYILVYVYLNYLRASILKSISNSISKISTLNSLLKTKSDKSSDLSHQIKESQDFIFDLDRKFKKWSEFKESELGLLNLEKKTIESDIKTRRSRQSEVLSNYFLSLEILPECMDSARTDLKTVYSNKENQQKFIQGVFSNLNKEHFINETSE